MSPITALVRTVRLDLRPVVGSLTTLVASITVCTAVVAGALALLGQEDAATDGGAGPLETIVELTAFAGISAIVYAMRCFAASLRPEVSALRAIGAPGSSALAFGALVAVSGAAIGTLVALSVGRLIADEWVRQLSDLLEVHPPTAHTHLVAPWVAGCALVPAVAGWRSGLTTTERSRPVPRWVHFTTAAVLVVVICAPAAFVVSQAPVVGALVEQRGDARAAERLSLLDGPAGHVVMLGAASLALGIAVLLTAGHTTSMLMSSLRRLSGRLPLGSSVGLRIAAVRVDRFAPLVTITAACLLLLQTHALTKDVATSVPAAARGAGSHELVLTLGPTLVQAAVCATGASLAQSRSTGDDLNRLRLMGAGARTRWTVVITAAVALGSAAVLVATVAYSLVALIGSSTGAVVDLPSALSNPTSLWAAAVAVFGTAAVFAASEVAGAVASRTR